MCRSYGTYHLMCKDLIMVGMGPQEFSLIIIIMLKSQVRIGTYKGAMREN